MAAFPSLVRLSREPKGSPNTPTQLVFIALNTLPYKQKVEVARILTREEKR